MENEIKLAPVKKCSCCGETKTLDSFGVKNASKDGLNSHCKSCCKLAKKKNYYANRLEEYVVYVLPNLNAYGYDSYCGVTDNPSNRMPDHKYKGNNTEGWFIVGTFKDINLARQVERAFHEDGYAGAWGWRTRNITKFNNTNTI